MTPTNTKRRTADAGLSGLDKQREGLREPDKGQGIVSDERGQEQPADKKRAQQSAGLRAQKDAAQERVPSPGEPAGGE